MTDRETLAQVLHEAGRKTVVESAFTEWDDLSETCREARRIQADFLLENLYVEKPEPQTSEDKAVAVVLNELHRAQAKHPGRMFSRHQAWGVIEEEHVKFRRAVEKNDYDEARKRLATTAAMCIQTLCDWPLIQHVESDLTILQTLEPSVSNEHEA